MTGRSTANGTNLIRPANYREWVFLSSSLDLNYPPPGAPPGPQRFDNVFVNPSSYRAFMQTGKWPDKTIFVLEFREASKEASPDRPGKFQAAMTGVEAEVKDSRFPDGWAFFAFGQPGPPNAGVAPLSGDTVARCIDCHTDTPPWSGRSCSSIPRSSRWPSASGPSSQTTPIPDYGVSNERRFLSRAGPPYDCLSARRIDLRRPIRWYECRSECHERQCRGGRGQHTRV